MATFAGMEASWLDPPDEGDCPTCDGTGAITCELCEGSGCRSCLDGEKTCKDYGGSGFLPYEPFDDDVI